MNGFPDSITDNLSPMPQIIIVAMVFFFLTQLSTVLASPISEIVMGSAFAIALIAGPLIVHFAEPENRFEPGNSEATHEYHDLTIRVHTSIHHMDDEGEMIGKVREVDCMAIDEDGTTVIHENDTELVGTEPHWTGIMGGDFDSARSTSDHVLAVASNVHEQVDEWLAAGGNDLETKSVLESEFGDEMPEQDVELEEQNE